MRVDVHYERRALKRTVFFPTHLYRTAQGEADWDCPPSPLYGGTNGWCRSLPDPLFRQAVISFFEGGLALGNYTSRA